MKLSQLKQEIETLSQLNFILPNGEYVPPHFHVTEVGLTTKQFTDCGGTIRTERFISFQLWSANGIDHRLSPLKFKRIIESSEPLFGSEYLKAEFEYQSESIGRYGLESKDNHFYLTAKQTNSLAIDRCGVPKVKPKIRTTTSSFANTSYNSPNSSCC